MDTSVSFPPKPRLRSSILTTLETMEGMLALAKAEG